jgi:hypothetical protein
MMAPDGSKTETGDDKEGVLEEEGEGKEQTLVRMGSHAQENCSHDAWLSCST